MALTFPFAQAPQKNQAIDICPEVKWIRSPLPLTLDHINCYLIKDGDGWVDTISLNRAQAPKNPLAPEIHIDFL